MRNVMLGVVLSAFLSVFIIPEKIARKNSEWGKWGCG